MNLTAPDGAEVRVPAAGNLPIVNVEVNTTCTVVVRTRDVCTVDGCCDNTPLSTVDDDCEGESLTTCGGGEQSPPTFLVGPPRFFKPCARTLDKLVIRFSTDLSPWPIAGLPATMCAAVLAEAKCQQ